MANTTGRKVQVPVLGGLRKVIRVGGGGASGTTLDGFDGQTLTLAQLRTLLGLGAGNSAQVTPSGGGGGATAQIVLGPGLAGGGAVTGAVPINLTAPIPVFFDDGGGDGDSIPIPGKQGINGTTGSPGPAGPAIYFTDADAPDEPLMIPGTRGPAGATGTNGTVGINGPAVYLTDAADAEDQVMIPGVPGPAGPTGPIGPAGSGGGAIWLPYDDGLIDNEPIQVWTPPSAGGVAANITPDTHPASPTSYDDEFESGTTINLSQWTWRQQNTATAVVSKGSVLLTAQVTSSNIINAFDQALPTGVCSFVCKAGGLVPSYNNVITPIFLYEPSSGKAFGLGIVLLSGIVTLVSVATTALASSWLTNPTPNRGATVPLSNANNVSSPQIYWRTDIGSTTITVSFSWDGFIWSIYGTYTTTTLFTTAPTRIGVSVTANNAAAATANLSMDWFRRTA